jgi:hypothetical protein
MRQNCSRVAGLQSCLYQGYIKALSPFITRHIKRYGDYIVNLQSIPQPLNAAINLPLEIFDI